MRDLELTGHGIYYFHKYVPWKKRDLKKYSDYIEISDRVLNYKKGKPIAKKVLTKELEESIVFLSNKVFAGNVNEIALVAVPPSKTDKYSPIRDSINQIVDRYENGEITEFKYLEKLHNCANLLTRIIDVESSKNDKSKRIKFNHYRSIDFNEDLVSQLDNVTFILIDDITTTGFTMEICEDILIDNGIDEDNIYKLAISETVDDYYG